jgi:hypothetical protein
MLQQADGITFVHFLSFKEWDGIILNISNDKGKGWVKYKGMNKYNNLDHSST